MDRVWNFAGSAADHSVKTVAAAVIICTLMEPVCKLVKSVWESRILVDDNAKTESFIKQKAETTYESIEGISFKGRNWVGRLTMIGVTFNKYRPFAHTSFSTLAVSFMFAAMVFKSYK